MKKIVLILVLLTTNLTVCNNIKANALLREVIIIKPASQPGTVRQNRSLDYVPISAFYDNLTSSVYVSFDNNLGQVQIQVFNLSNCISVDYDVQYGETFFVVPIEDSGEYEISFILSDGTKYIGYFAS